MRYYVDCEFNGNDGQLISIGIVDPFRRSFYKELPVYELVKPWIAENVITRLTESPTPRAEVTDVLREYLKKNASHPVTFVADWPEDFSHVLSLMLVGDRLRISPASFRMVHLDLPGFNTNQTSTTPHHALCDAIALMEYVEQGISDGEGGALVAHDLLLLRDT